MCPRATVMVVEDERDLADLYADWLGDAYLVRTATTAEDALQQMDDTVDVVLLDRRLPGMEGDEFLRRVREAEYDCSVTMVSAVDPDFDILEMGFDDYLVKPVTRGVLETTVETLVARQLYNEEVQEYFTLASKRATLETRKSAETLADSPEYQALLDDLGEHRRHLDDLVDGLQEDDVVAVFRDLRVDELGTPT